MSNDNSNEKIKITIFSTKLIREKNGLFTPDTLKVENVEVKKLLRDYFIHLDVLLYNMMKDDTKKRKLKVLLFNCSEKNNPTNDDEIAAKYREDDLRKRGVDVSIPCNADFVKKRIDSDFNERGANNGAILKRIIAWNLEEEMLNICIGGQEWDDLEKRTTLYHIAGSHVYALKCLDEENDELDKNQVKWIPCLIRCAQCLTNNPEKGIDLCLVLHDADLGRGTDFTKQDVVFVDKDKVIENKLDCGTLRDVDLCRIIFFQHTVNPITNILCKRVETGKEVREYLESVMLNYGKLNMIKDKAKKALESKCGITELKALDKELTEIINFI